MRRTRIGADSFDRRAGPARQCDASALPYLDKAQATLAGILARTPGHEVARFYTAYALSWRARALGGMGGTEQATAIALKVETIPALPGEVLYDLAACSLSARRGGPGREPDAARTIALLRRSTQTANTTNSQPARPLQAIAATLGGGGPSVAHR